MSALRSSPEYSLTCAVGISTDIFSIVNDLLLKIQAYSIALMDLNLYLDVFPNDNTLTNLYRQYKEEKEKLVNEFEKEFYPLTPGTSAQNGTWKWLDGTWPWEREK